MHLISASRRTDVPAFYADWFMRRTRAGDVSWINPFNAQVHTVSLAPGDVAAIVFWTRNFAPMIRHLDELEGRGYRYLAHFTITGLERTYESHVPPLGAAVAQFRRIADRIGPERILWRYDPILIAPRCGPDFHLRKFEALASAREECGCVRSYDVGAYDTCLHGCIYCYATRDRETARQVHARHDPESPTLILRRAPTAVP